MFSEWKGRVMLFKNLSHFWQSESLIVLKIVLNMLILVAESKEKKMRQLSDSISSQFTELRVG